MGQRHLTNTSGTVALSQQRRIQAQGGEPQFHEEQKQHLLPLLMDLQVAPVPIQVLALTAAHVAGVGPSS